MALLQENGPCWANKDGSGTTLNEHSWTNKANVIWVGFLHIQLCCVYTLLI